MQVRPRRSVLYMPGLNERALDKARTIPADSLILDLEDSVAPEGKAAARAGVLVGETAVGLSHDTFSKITDSALDEMKAWRGPGGPAAGGEIYPILYLDALLEIRDGHQVRNRAAYIAVGVDLDGIRRARPETESPARPPARATSMAFVAVPGRTATTMRSCMPFMVCTARRAGRISARGVSPRVAAPGPDCGSSPTTACATRSTSSR